MNRARGLRFVGLGAILALASLGSACRLECATMSRWDELSVELGDPEDPEQAYAALWVEAALESFARWSGRDEICVAGVTVVSGMDAHTMGEYHTGTAEITVLADADDPWSSTTHELCHAIDTAEGIAPDHPDLFDPASVTNRDAYPYRRLRSSEAFARICGLGPQDIERWRVWDDDCGVRVTDQDLDALELTRDEVFPLAERSTWDRPSVDARWGEAWSLPELGEGWTARRLLADGGQALLLSERNGEGWIRIDVLDPQSGTPSATHTLQPCGQVKNCSWDEMQAEDGAWLQASWDGGWAWWRLTAAGVEQVPSPCATEEDAAVSGGVAWSFAEREWEYSALSGCHLETGAQLRPPGLAPSLRPYGPEDDIALPYLTPAAARPTIRWFGVGYAWLEPGGSDWSRRELPWHLDLRSTAALPDGRWLLDIHDWSEVTEESLRATAWLDPATGAMQTPLDPCPRRSSDPGVHHQLAAAGEGWALYLDNSSLSASDVTLRPLTWD